MRNHLPGMLESPLRCARNTCQRWRKHLQITPEPPTGCQNHLPAIPEPLGGHSRITCPACRNHFSDVPQPRAGHAGTTSRTDWNHLANPPEPPAKYARTTYLTRRNHLPDTPKSNAGYTKRSEEHTSELQSRQYLVCRLLLDKKNIADSQSTR